MKSIKEYRRADGTSPFGQWFDGLHPVAAAKVVTAKSKLQNGIGDIKPVGEGVLEIRIDWGPGYRVYFGQDGLTLVILLAGGDKSTQEQDIKDAKACWDDYKQRKNRSKR
ncbi:type II toxin-antitoxin system RelE/ParE family toxin [Niveispirillum cyanobacteriorum]|uniref:type II toxin-antitoxin system RelE/ParE family toxin n=1 Tax=Niveispirillum cyanobacteriorum TaxID=1612173 RepID=UPI00166408C6|nr:type II toxin-antitoxin system RelE/ParE family toxin [Niveispirillum cyanobacteriorum]GGE82007.1 hypothetical protein GCM10011317_44020 [Niveispirillum cyanobacteriorum]